MTTPIQRWAIDFLPGHGPDGETTSDDGDWCRSDDVAAVEKERDDSVAMVRDGGALVLKMVEEQRALTKERNALAALAHQVDVLSEALAASDAQLHTMTGEMATLRKYLKANETLWSNFEINERLERCDKAEAEVARLRDAQQWISCAERMPKREGRYAILYSPGDGERLRQFTTDYHLDAGWANIINGAVVHHWMLLPAPPGQAP